MSNERIRISRRKALVGLGSIGLASAGAGIGTYAQFTDEEENSATFTAGGIDGKLSWSGSYNGNEVDGQLENVKVSENTVSGAVHFTDVKPGDYGCVNFGIEVDNNPAWVASCLDVTENIDNRVFEPEVEADEDLEEDQIGEGPVTVEGEGELAQNMLTLPYYDSDGSCTFFDSGGPVAPEDPENVLTASEFWSNTQDEDDPKFPVGEAANDGQRYYLAPRTVKDVSENLQSRDTARWTERGQSLDFIEAPNGTEVGTGCVMLEGDSADGSDTGNNTQGVSPLQPNATLNFGYDFHLPFETGNAAQGDRMTLSFGFKFLQVRHTEAPNFGSYSPGSNTPNDTSTST